MIAIGSDHAGYGLKTGIIEYLSSKGLEYKDFGACDGKNPVDYPDYGKTVAEAVGSGEFEKGIIICGTGIGISIAANKVPGIRAALCTDSYMAKMSREHNNANILALGGRVIGLGLALDIVETWLNASFAGGKHTARVKKINEMDEKYLKK
ncbi:MAG: ribose 5-phosphate isomerase B [Ruminiclostridium sp.]|nr:ribose 5-phosphate isomerase B [Ruminiclostridium sp.]